MFESPRHCATKIAKPNKEGPLDDHGNTAVHGVQTYFQDLCMISSTGYRLPALMAVWTHLFLEGDTNAACKKLYSQLLEDLMTTAGRVWEKNKERPVDYTKMMPDDFECSVCI